MNPTSRTCSIENCGRSIKARGWCNRHYHRFLFTGSPTVRASTPLPDLPGEQWKPISGYEGFYEVSNKGRVKSVRRTITHSNGTVRTIQARLLKPGDYRGYKRVCLAAGGSKKIHSVAPLVLEAFIGPRPDGYHSCHNNGIKDDNRVENLRWDTPTQNMLDKTEHGTNHNLNKTHCPKGHPYTPANTGPKKWERGIGRRCRKCHRDKERARNARAA